jgi:exopolyphosphatase/guanosine-5'-triphosphate,3'-diphosphate pyrophosphatase
VNAAPAGSVAVIDIGSNSIKILVAARDASGALRAQHYRTIDARISAGISRSEPRLSEEGMARGLAAITSLLADATAHAASRLILVATSAVRDARNGADFIARVHAATGQHIRLLSGDEEANLIGRGLTCDPALAGLRDFYVFDLGGGSLECLAFRDRRITQAVSLRLGCVRLTEKFIADPTAPFIAAHTEAIAAHVRELIQHAGFSFSLPATAPAIGTGGTVTSVRTIQAARTGRPLAETPTRLSVATLRSLLHELGSLPLAERQHIAGLPAARADVFPTALATVITLAELGGFEAFENSLYNLRWGLVAEALDPASA